MGRKVKLEKILRDAKSKLNGKSRKRKLNEDDSNNANGKGCHTESRGDDDSHQSKRKSKAEKIEETEKTEKTEMIEKKDKRDIDIHLLSDLRGLTNLEERNAKYYAAELFCSGGDNACRSFSKNYSKKMTLQFSSSSPFSSSTSSSPSFSSSSAPLCSAKSSHSTTAMDFER